jgi:hypothetical protein
MRKTQAIFGLLLAAAASAMGAATLDARVALVASLYREFAWEVVVIEPRAPTFLLQPEAVLEKYLAPDLLKLLMKDRACATERREICSLDFSPIWAGNDPGAIDLRVTPGAKPGEVRVRFIYPYDKKSVELIYDMVQIGSSWRIANIRAKDWSLVSILQSPQ